MIKIKLHFISGDAVTVNVDTKEYDSIKRNLGQHCIVEDKDSETLINLYYVNYVEVV